MSDELHEALVTTLEWLVDIPSATREEAEIADRLQERLERCESHAFERWRHGFVVVPRGEVAPTLLLVGHLDTVPPSPEQTRRREGGRVYGCGTTDMKAGVAVMLALLERCPQAPAAYLFYDREEGPLSENGLSPLLDLLPPSAGGIPAVVLEPTNNEVQVGCVGSFHVKVTFEGVRSHSARPWQGRNALYEALPLLAYLRDRAPDDVTIDGQVFRQVITPTIMGTPALANAVPGEATLNLNVRFAPGNKPETLLEEIRREAGPHARLELLDVAPAGDVCHRHPSLAPWIAECGLEVTPKQAWTDVAQLSARGFPAVNFGPGEPAQAHQPDEWTPEAALLPCYEALVRLLLRS